MPTIKNVHSRVRHLAGRDINIHYGGAAAAPPDDASLVMICPQCGQRTWRHSRHCVHCMLDLWLWHAGSAVMAGLKAAATLGHVVGHLLLDRRPRGRGRL